MIDATRATARLPHLELEMCHRRLPDEQAEQLAISLKATPSFADFAQLLERQMLWPWLALQPWLVWAQIAQAAWQPWLAALYAAAPVAEPRLRSGAASDEDDVRPGQAPRAW